ncbi:unnamed protein product [Rangifer tarandus platyrhynchus]|uniref:Uncharacterized protein n=1 Tax=Rangifer tarandus platyrhynchus TaxID=3082113 RepID=A0AC59Z2R2_RANTA
MGFSRQEHWSRLPFPLPGDLPGPGTNPKSPALAGGFCTTSATWEALTWVTLFKTLSNPQGRYYPPLKKCKTWGLSVTSSYTQTGFKSRSANPTLGLRTYPQWRRSLELLV